MPNVRPRRIRPWGTVESGRWTAEGAEGRSPVDVLRGPLKRLAMEPPLRPFVRAVLKRLPARASTRALRDISERPAYLVGVHHAARRAMRVVEPGR